MTSSGRSWKYRLCGFWLAAASTAARCVKRPRTTWRSTAPSASSSSRKDTCWPASPVTPNGGVHGSSRPTLRWTGRRCRPARTRSGAPRDWAWCAASPATCTPSTPPRRFPRPACCRSGPGGRRRTSTPARRSPGSWPRPAPLVAATYETLVGLLETTGMRVGEAVRLDRADVDLDDGVITVVAGKFGRWREVPLQPGTVGALSCYARRRDALCPEPKAPSFLVSNTGTRLIPACVRQRFGQLVRAAGLGPRSPRCRPRIHDFRHGFAVPVNAGVDTSVIALWLVAFSGDDLVRHGS